ncbi:hypothetical protein KIPB_010126, partial [Kipferlia bialata]
AVREVLALVDLSNTLFLVTADHECGALDIDATQAKATAAAASMSCLKTTADTDIDAAVLARTERIALLEDSFTWGSDHHSSRHVMLAGSGPGASGVEDLEGRLLHHKGTSMILHRAADPEYEASINFGYFEAALYLTLAFAILFGAIGGIVYLIVKLVKRIMGKGKTADDSEEEGEGEGEGVKGGDISDDISLSVDADATEIEGIEGVEGERDQFCIEGEETNSCEGEREGEAEAALLEGVTV